jgi:glycosyltransferase involved in cell wall biosynthesis
MKIALLEPFYTGSHQYWCEQLLKHSCHEISLFKLPGVHWKWRMHGAAIELAKQLNQSHQSFDLILCSSMMDIALLKASLKKQRPIICYFHENQFAYPSSKNDRDKELERDLHYSFTNYTSALISDLVIFNSQFNQNSFLNGLEAYLKRLPDFKGLENSDRIRKKSKVVPVGINLAIEKRNHSERLKTIVWNHRWEHDKNPEGFYEILKSLKKEAFDFKLIMLGQAYAKYPVAFNKIKDDFKDEIIHWGYAKDRMEYLKILETGDLNIVSSFHDFQGLSVLESMFLGLTVYAPNRLVYPEYIPKKNLYNSMKELVQKILENSGINEYKLAPYTIKETTNKMDEIISLYKE